MRIKNNNQIKLAIVGLGYVGLPLALSFSKKKTVIAFDKDKERISNLKKGLDKNCEYKKRDILYNKNIFFSSSPSDLSNCNFFIITVPTPIFNNKKPNLSYLKNATILISKYIQKGSFIVYESTVYPGCTEEICIPIIEKLTQLKLNKDFYCGFSPERINPGDKLHNFENIIKVVSGSNDYSKKIINNLYKMAVKAGTHLAENIKTAEAAKIIENTQRDINIALINEFSILCDKMGLNTNEVLKSASSKWNFHNFQPGLVGGHCIGVDPYYLAFKAKSLNLDTSVILAGRKRNDSMPKFIVKKLFHKIKERGLQNITNLKILILGVTFKENCSDVRNSKSIEIIRILRKFEPTIHVYDPLALLNDLEKKEFKLINRPKKSYYDIIILSVPHDKIIKKGIKYIEQLSKNSYIFFDLKSSFSKKYSDYSM